MELKIERKSSTVGQFDLVILQHQEMTVKLTSYGAAIYEIRAFNQLVTVAPMDMDEFLTSSHYYGKTIGRTSGRLVVPSYQIDNQSYLVKPFDAPKTQLHGGKTGFAFRNFDILETKVLDRSASVTFKYVSRDQEEDFPGTLTLLVTYVLKDDNTLAIYHEATTTKDTLCNITNHVYFNLERNKSNMMNHQLMISSSAYLDIDREFMIKEKHTTSHTPFDFRKMHRLGDGIHNMQQTSFRGFDHTWIFDQSDLKVELFDPSSKISLKLYTDYPAVVIYTHNFPSPNRLESFNHDGRYAGLTLECQYEPGGIHHQFLNSAILRQNERYQHQIVFVFEQRDSL